VVVLPGAMGWQTVETPMISVVSVVAQTNVWTVQAFHSEHQCGTSAVCVVALMHAWTALA